MSGLRQELQRKVICHGFNTSERVQAAWVYDESQHPGGLTPLDRCMIRKVR